MRRLLALAAMIAVSGCATTQPQDSSFVGGLWGEALKGAQLDAEMAKAAAHPFGSEQNPVRTNMPEGERAYLERLRCSDGNAPAFERGGSVGTGPYGTILDVYNLRCLAGQPATAEVYMDMYHAHVEDRPVPGFTIKPK